MHVPCDFRRFRPFLAGCSTVSYETRADAVLQTSTAPVDPLSYNKGWRSGLSTPPCGASMSLSSSRFLQHTDADRISYVALSLAPFSWRRRMAERLRAGESPARILDDLSEAQP